MDENLEPNKPAVKPPWYKGLRRWLLAIFALIVGAVMLSLDKMAAAEFVDLAIGIIAVFGGTDAVDKVSQAFRRGGAS